MRWESRLTPFSFDVLLLLFISFSLFLVPIVVAQKGDINLHHATSVIHTYVPTATTTNAASTTETTEIGTKSTPTLMEYEYSIAGASLKEDPATLPDGTLVFLVNLAIQCEDQSISLQILYANGTTDKFDNLPKDSALFCNIDYATTLKVLPLNYDSVIVTYIMRNHDTSLYEHRGIIIDVKEKTFMYNKTLYEYPNNLTVENATLSTFFCQSIDPEKGFLTMYFNLNQSYWAWWTVTDKGDDTIELVNEYNDTVSFEEIDLFKFKTPAKGPSLFPTKDGGFGIAYTIFNVNGEIDDPSIATGQVYVKILDRIDRVLKGPFLIYQTSLNITGIGLNSCSMSYDDNSGNKCLLELDMTNNSSLRTLKIDFWTTGSVKKITRLGDDRIKGGVILSGQPLNTGGFLITILNDGLTGYLVDDTGAIVTDWGLPSDVDLVSGVFPNNTVWALYNNPDTNDLSDLSESNNNKFSIISSKLESLNTPNDYGNTLIKSTSPGIGDTLMIDDDYKLRSEILIEFADKVQLSQNNLYIYQIDGFGPSGLLRQKISATDKLTLDKEGQLLHLTNVIYDSTFNQPGLTYYIKMESDFVESLIDDEPLFGIPDFNWNFTLSSIKGQKSSSTRLGILKLTKDYSKSKKKDLSNSGRRKKILESLINDLASVIPCDVNRLKVIDSNFVEIGTADEQFAVKIKIDKPSPNYVEPKPSPEKIFSDLKELIKNKNNTDIINRNIAKYLDQDAGFIDQANFWEKYQVAVFISSFGLISLIILYIISQRVFKEGRNFSIFRHSLIITDFILDILFVLNSASTVRTIFIPSVAFTLIPAIINLMMAAYIIVHEISHNRSFRNWINKFATVTVWVTLMSVADIKNLALLTSRIAGLDCFDAPFRKKTFSWVFWLSIISLLLEDIPHLIIQIIFQQQSITDDVIPKLTLITSVIVLTADILWRCYYGLMHFLGYYKHEEHFWGPSEKKSSTEINDGVFSRGNSLLLPSDVIQSRFRRGNSLLLPSDVIRQEISTINRMGRRSI